ncbi:hypothetical protein KHA90_15780 [Flavobacterium psychroterrae]|uniref:Uncharacterized protein n=1 Tax=Flavobacterium psychroterrae TaxID=2133767 RepID=A0ABS5PDX2_9FLAO|nr:hypothetical protein [Flavobacterium psychroterrae]MBS7232479.1 hypothetical protein [Flavobacterium psychroterrae]
MKIITSKETLLKKLKKENILSNGRICYLTDFHKTKCGKVLVEKLIKDRTLEKTRGYGAWFETEWKLRKPVGNHLGVDIFLDHTRNQYFFKVKKGVYDIDTYQYCIAKLEYLNKLGEKLT